MGVVNSVHASTTHHRIDKGEVPMVHTKTRLSAEQAYMGEQRRGSQRVTNKNINTNSNTRWTEDDDPRWQLEEGMGSFDVLLGCILPVMSELAK